MTPSVTRRRQPSPAAFACVLTAIGLSSVQAQAQTELVLHNFGRGEGAQPYAGVVRDLAGNLYGTGLSGGPDYDGIVYELDTAGRYTILHAFSGFGDGAGPLAGVVLDPAGNLYGTTQSGGTAQAGVIYKLDPTGQQTILYNFTGGANGEYPDAGVILDPAGNLYGTAGGAVYKLDTAGQYTVLYSFLAGPMAAAPSPE